jgi:hypothetical protein
MTDIPVPSPDAALLPLIALIVGRQSLGEPPIFRSEFVIANFILALTLACFIAPARSKRLIGLVIAFSIGIAMARFPHEAPGVSA